MASFRRWRCVRSSGRAFLSGEPYGGVNRQAGLRVHDGMRRGLERRAGYARCRGLN